MQASDLLLIGPNGDILMGGKPELQLYNRAAFAIHHAIHKARPDVDAACHSHSLYAKAWSTLGKEIQITTQDSCVFYGKVSHSSSVLSHNSLMHALYRLDFTLRLAA